MCVLEEAFLHSGQFIWNARQRCDRNVEITKSSNCKFAQWSQEWPGSSNQKEPCNSSSKKHPNLRFFGIVFFSTYRGFCDRNFTACTMTFRARWLNNREKMLTLDPEKNSGPGWTPGIGSLNSSPVMYWNSLRLLFFVCYHQTCLINPFTFIISQIFLLNKVLLHLNKQQNVKLIKCLSFQDHGQRKSCAHSEYRNKRLSVRHFQFVLSLEGYVVLIQ